MGNVKMQKVDLCVIQDNELAQVFLKTEKKPAVATVVKRSVTAFLFA